MYKAQRISPSSVLLVLPFWLAAGTVAQAADASADQAAASSLQEVVVTAQKREEKLHDVPMGITAITSDDLDKQRILDLEDLQSKVPALSLQAIQPGQTRLAIRGQNVGSVGSTVATYIDDTPFGSSNALANGSLLTGDFDTWDLQRVEVLRGPQGTLYGAGSEGGLLKYVTNPPDPSKFASAIQVGGEDIAHGEAAGSVKGMVNLPITNQAAFRISGYYTMLPGYIDDPSLGEKDVNHGYREGLRASLLWQATDNFSVRVSALGENLHTHGSPYVDVVGAAGNFTAPPPNQFDPTAGDYDQHRFIDEPSLFKYRVYSLTLDWNLGWGTATSITSYGSSEQNLFTDATSIQAVPTFTYGDLASSVTMQPTGVAETNDLNVKKWTEEVRLASSGTQKLEWQVGAFFTRESSTLDQTLPTYFIPSQMDSGLPSLENVALDAIYREYSAFGQVTYHFVPQFDLALGLRWSENKQSADEMLSGLLVAPTTFTGDSTGTDFTYAIAPRWHITDTTMAYARVATGYRPGGPNALPPGTTGVPPTYQADSTVNYELGTRTDLLDHRVSIDVAAFVVNWHKIQLLEDVGGFGVNTNGGTARSKGVEWTLGATPVTGLTFTLTGAYVDAYLTEDALAAGGHDGDPLPYVPKWSTSLDGAYTWRAFGDFSAFTGATWSYVGSRFSDFGLVPGGAEPVARAELPSYNTVNLRAGLDDARWTFELYVKNIGDERGIVYYLNQSSPNLGGVIGLSQPRTVGATISARF